MLSRDCGRRGVDSQSQGSSFHCVMLVAEPVPGRMKGVRRQLALGALLEAFEPEGKLRP